ncbi:MAG: signal peptidase II [Candidatus Melainabacteria bacterium]|nr:signal peptidase II [Candidatus Melainabacteria bacterium]
MLWLALVLVLDRLTKIWAMTELKSKAAVEILPGVLEFRYAENTGIAFSLLNDMPMLLTLVNSLIVLALIYWAWSQKQFGLGMILIIAGGLGNLIDRFLYGYVVDFINPLFIDFAVFNISDIALNIGVAIIIWESISESLSRRKRA